MDSCLRGMVVGSQTEVIVVVVGGPVGYQWDR